MASTSRSPCGQRTRLLQSFHWCLLQPDTKGCLGHLVLSTSAKGFIPPPILLLFLVAVALFPQGSQRVWCFFAKYVAAIFFFFTSQYWGWKPELWMGIPTIALP